MKYSEPLIYLQLLLHEKEAKVIVLGVGVLKLDESFKIDAIKDFIKHLLFPLS